MAFKIGYVDPSFNTPEELIMAANLIPHRIFGDPTIDLMDANKFVPPNHCFWARNCLQRGLNGLDKDIKGIIITHACDCSNREFDIWFYHIPYDFYYFLNAPLKRDKISLKFFINDIKELKFQLEEHFGVEITDKKLYEAINLTNEIRKLLKKISEYRNKGLLLGSEFHAIIKNAYKSDKKDVLHNLKEKLKKLEIKEPLPYVDGSKKRILLTGSILDDTEILKYLESLGFEIITDDLCIGTRYFHNKIEITGDPIKDIANFHLSKPPYSTEHPSSGRFDFIKGLAEKYQVQGVICLVQKFCEPLLYEYPFFRDSFKKIGMPFIFLEKEYKRDSYNQLTTKFEAFKEILEGVKK